MRLTPQQVETVRTLAHRHFGADAAIWLFGSRSDNGKKGGDYDFFIETSLDEPDVIVAHRIAMIVDLQSSAPFEDEKIDLIVKRRSSSFTMPVYSEAKQGVHL